MHGSLAIVDEDRALDADLVSQPTCCSELLIEIRMRRKMLTRMRFACVDEVPAVAGMLRR